MSQEVFTCPEITIQYVSSCLSCNFHDFLKDLFEILILTYEQSHVPSVTKDIFKNEFYIIYRFCQTLLNNVCFEMQEQESA